MAGQKKKHADLALLDTLPRDQIQNLFEAGVSETRICMKLGVSKKALTEWLDRPANEGFLSRVRARAADHLVSETIEIADETDISEVNKARVRIQTRQWVAERWNPAAYAQNKMPSVTVNLANLRLDALRHGEVIEAELPTDKRG
jgi:transposase